MAHLNAATLINAERSDCSLRLLENFPSLTITVRQDTSGRDLVASTYSATGMSAAARNLNPLANFRHMRQPGYLRPPHTALKPLPLRTAIMNGYESLTRHNGQIQVTPGLRELIKECAPELHESILPATVQHITPLSLATRLSMVCAGLHCDDLVETRPVTTSLTVAFTTKVLILAVDPDEAKLAVNARGADHLLTVDGASTILTNFGYDIRGNVRRDAPQALSPSDLPDCYPVLWLGAVAGLIAVQLETDLDQLGMNLTEQKTLTAHPPAVDAFMRKLQSFALLSSRLFHLCVAHALEPFRDMAALLRVWQAPTLVQIPEVSLAIKGPSIEVQGNGTQLFQVRAAPIGGM
ncbi:NS38 [American grass carp reovirus]|uniref:Non-structural protein 2 n=1 Tax=Aquareovirus G (isolate American grass carp/USA/PB01-155/-) TaxID=648234 RepID=VNS2_AQRVG|nr:NS38 [American grass carp reovirus]B2BNE8.1 RecName: Full=Non-structural protein 2; Short=NS2 [American grass carp reovirus PB01-155]ABV01048.1 NS38 [American grass carp reovirus]